MYQRIAINIFDRSVDAICLVVYSPTGGFTKQYPVGSAITGPFETVGINNGFHPINWMVIDFLPLPRKNFSAFRQYM
jgi:hypothetical protein